MPNFTQCWKNSDLRRSPQVFLKKLTNEWLFDINEEIVCLVSVLTGCSFSGRQFSRGHRLILFKRRLKQQKAYHRFAKKNLGTSFMYRLNTTLMSRKMFEGMGNSLSIPGYEVHVRNKYLRKVQRQSKTKKIKNKIPYKIMRTCN